MCMLCVCSVTDSCLTICDSMDCSHAALSMRFPRQEYWNGLPFPSPGDLTDPGIEPTSPALAGGFFTPEPPGNTHLLYKRYSARKFLCWLFFNPQKSPLMLVLQPLYFTDGAQ